MNKIHLTQGPPQCINDTPFREMKSRANDNDHRIPDVVVVVFRVTTIKFILHTIYSWIFPWILFDGSTSSVCHLLFVLKSLRITCIMHYMRSGSLSCALVVLHFISGNVIWSLDFFFVKVAYTKHRRIVFRRNPCAMLRHCDDFPRDPCKYFMLFRVARKTFDLVYTKNWEETWGDSMSDKCRT